MPPRRTPQLRHQNNHRLQTVLNRESNVTTRANPEAIRAVRRLGVECHGLWSGYSDRPYQQTARGLKERCRSCLDESMTSREQPGAS